MYQISKHAAVNLGVSEDTEFHGTILHPAPGWSLFPGTPAVPGFLRLSVEEHLEPDSWRTSVAYYGRPRTAAGLTLGPGFAPEPE